MLLRRDDLACNNARQLTPLQQHTRDKRQRRMFPSLVFPAPPRLTVPSLPVETTKPVGNVCTHVMVPNPSGFPPPQCGDDGEGAVLALVDFRTSFFDEEAGRDGGAGGGGCPSLTTIRESSSKLMVNSVRNCDWFRVVRAGFEAASNSERKRWKVGVY